MSKKRLTSYSLKWNPFSPQVPVEALTVTPPIDIPVTSAVWSAEANDSLETPSSLRTRLLTSRRVSAVTMQAAYTGGGFLDATRIVFPE